MQRKKPEVGLPPKTEEKKLEAPPRDAEPDPFAEFHDGWEPVRKRRSDPPAD